MSIIRVVTLAIALMLALASCKKDDKPGSTPPSSPTPATESQPAGGVAPTPSAPTQPSAPPTGNSADKTADAHKGHRHEPSDPYACPMHPEETSQDPNATCPVCQMKMEPRKK
jgi:hypothetical protein